MMQAAESRPDDLGAVLQESKTNHGMAKVAFLCGPVFVLLGVMSFLVRPPGQDGPEALQYSMAALFCLAGLAYMAWGVVMVYQNKGLTLYLHENGIRKVVRGAESVMRFEDADELTFSTTRVFVNGVYGGTVEHIGLKSNATGAEPIHFRRKYEEKTGKVTAYQESTASNRTGHKIAALVAHKLAPRLARGESIPWAKKLTLHPWGVEGPNGWGGKVKVKWDEIDKVDINQGIFRLYAKGKKSPALTVYSGLPNFWPGYLLLASRLKS